MQTDFRPLPAIIVLAAIAVSVTAMEEKSGQAAWAPASHYLAQNWFSGPSAGSGNGNGNGNVGSFNGNDNSGNGNGNGNFGSFNGNGNPDDNNGNGNSDDFNGNGKT